MIETNYQYKVCTRCYTFNQASYIKDAMDGFTMQKTSFPFVTIIIDDASTDGEQEVIKEYLKEHFQEPYRKEETEYADIICAYHKSNPNCNFVVFLLKYNHHSIKKNKKVYLSEWSDNSKYIAICEGDDYWIHPNKLETQVAYMESNPDCGIVYAKAKNYSQESNEIIEIIGAKTEGYSDLLFRNTIPTLTVLYRNKLREGFEEILKANWVMSDYPLWLFISHKSRCHFWDEVVGVYRVLGESASHSNLYNKQILFFKSTYDIQSSFITQYGIGDIEKLNQNYYQGRFILAYNNNSEKDLKEFYPMVRKSFKNVVKYYYKRCLLRIKGRIQ